MCMFIPWGRYEDLIREDLWLTTKRLERVEVLKEWFGSELPRNLFKSIKVYKTNYKPKQAK